MISPNGESEQGARRGQGECGIGVHREVLAQKSQATELNLASELLCEQHRRDHNTQMDLDIWNCQIDLDNSNTVRRN